MTLLDDSLSSTGPFLHEVMTSTGFIWQNKKYKLTAKLPANDILRDSEE